MTLLDEFANFPYAKHDDGLDALEMAVRLASNGGFDIDQIKGILHGLRNVKQQGPTDIIHDMMKSAMKGNF